MPLYPILPSFAGGEVSEALSSRIDIEKYSTFLARCRNMLVLPQGGVTNRPGTFYSGTVKGSPVRLVPFVYSKDQSYVLEFGVAYIRFYAVVDDVAGMVTTADGDPAEVVTDFDADRLWEVSFIQSGDKLFLFCPAREPRVLTRLSHASWTLSELSFDPPPMGPVEPIEHELAFRRAGSLPSRVIAKNPSGVFSDADVGTYIRLEFMRRSSVVITDTARLIEPDGATSYESAVVQVRGSWELTARFSQGEPLDASDVNDPTRFSHGPYTLQIRIGSSGTWRDYAVMNDGLTHTITGEAPLTGDEDPHFLRVLGSYPARDFEFSIKENDMSAWALCSIWAVYPDWGQANIAFNRGVVPEDGQQIVTWYRQAFGPNNYPSCGAFYQDRLVLANTPGDPQAFWMSEVGDYYAFGWETPQEDDDAISGSLMGRQNNEIESMVALESLLFFTGGSTWRIAPGGDGKAISPSSMLARPQGEFGAAPLAPLVVGNNVLYVQRLASRVTALTYSLDVDSYEGPDMTVLARHLLEGHKIVDWAYQHEPWGIVWCVRDDGALLSLTYLKEHEVYAWALHETDGSFESVCSIPGERFDEVFFVVRRGANRCIERLARRWNGSSHVAEGGQFLDCALRHAEGMSYAIHEGKAVTVFASGHVYPDRTVTAGSVDSAGVSSMTGALVGLPYRSYLQTVELEVSGRQGTSMGRPKRINKIRMKLQESLGVKAGPDLGRLSLMKETATPSVIDAEPPELFSGYADQVVRGGYDDRGVMVVCQDEPYPLTLLALLPEFDNG
ncbi:hypothetical protein [Aminirod propionatiphilus]|uniref:Uncharacterized protein n=1 Tax=Aminirod propionatiphilus TaxID=3415223 RepID=A0ACD1DXZ9_9BACT|nr:hypothetical protein KIH16_04465 [Synergistota bacterium]